MATSVTVGRGYAAAYALLSLAFAIGAGVGLPYLLSHEIADLRGVLETLPAMFTRHTAITAMYAAPVAGLLFFSFFLVGARYCLCGKGVREKTGNRIVMAIAVLAVIALSSLFVARAVANAYWENQFRSAGYMRCPNSFMLTSKWFTQAWAQDPAYCRDPEVRAMMASPWHGIDDINEYLREREQER
ncbi:MAG: hypothetical protein JJU06_11450 [Ectothiorhodospiraceae bacterium]|nr:hypothetical protein [Ectothiorhodospiraceae bacterium]